MLPLSVAPAPALIPAPSAISTRAVMPPLSVIAAPAATPAPAAT